ncbi:MAG: hypothetical protein Ct9H90mP2_14640 [Dehalococcoidia bacterium]|nr:MAG: hypothetical protein Ct9H90mP2_14640 [Dehalococcoidia bacterium]
MLKALSFGAKAVAGGVVLYALQLRTRGEKALVYIRQLRKRYETNGLTNISS